MVSNMHPARPNLKKQIRRVRHFVFLTDNDKTKTKIMQIKPDVSYNKVPSSVEDKIYGFI